MKLNFYGPSHLASEKLPYVPVYWKLNLFPSFATSFFIEAWSILLASKPPGISIIEEDLSADSLKKMVENLSQSSYKL